MDWAAEAHAGQQYGDKPYTHHLARVIQVLREVGIEDPVMHMAAALHDTVEDTDTTIEEIRETFGDQVADLVWAVTTEAGKNRKERNAKTYPKVRATAGATVLKLADRIANVAHAWQGQNPILFMYHREYPDFRRALRHDPTGPEAEMWDALDRMLGWWEPPRRTDA